MGKYNNVLTLFDPNRVFWLTPEQKNILENYPDERLFFGKKLQKPNFLIKNYQIIFNKMQLSNQIRKILLFKGIWQNLENEPIKNQIKTRPKSVYI